MPLKIDPVISPDMVLSGNRQVLAKAITLIESVKPDDEIAAQALLAAVLPHTGKAIRIGLSGAPGVGKSSFIESFGLFLLDHGYRVGVLAIDPSSNRSGGSILGDKTRMERLSADPRAFIRPSPSRGALGGIARRTREAMLLMEAAGYDVILIETVGVGQSEIAVADMVDIFIVLVSPGGGDELQGIKRGIMELADLVIVTKADGDLETAAKRAQNDYRGALNLMRPKTPYWSAHVLLSSAKTGKGHEEIWAQILKHHSALTEAGFLAQLRADQAKAWMWAEIENRLYDALRHTPVITSLLPQLEPKVATGHLPPTAAAQQIIDAFRASSKGLENNDAPPVAQKSDKPAIGQ